MHKTQGQPAPQPEQASAAGAGAPAGGAAPDAEARRRSVLVVVLNNNEDLRRAAAEGWYRIPQRRAPRRIGADYLAFYQTGAFRRALDEVEAPAQAITWYAATRRYQLVTRRTLIPAEAGHPRADDYYYRVELGPLQRLAHPVRAASFHRVTFIHTTLAALVQAQDVVELFRKQDPFDTLWDALRAHQLHPLKNRLVAERPVDIALRARGGAVGIRCTADNTAREEPPLALPERWDLLTFSAAQIEQDLDGCLRRVGAALLGLGGSVLNLP